MGGGLVSGWWIGRLELVGVGGGLVGWKVSWCSGLVDW